MAIRKNMIKPILVCGALGCIMVGFGIGVLLAEPEAAMLLPNSSKHQMAALTIMSEEPEPKHLYTEADVDMLSRIGYIEARGVISTTERAAVFWCILNRLDNPARVEKTIAEVVNAPNQFDYRPNAPVTEEFKELAIDVLKRWECEKSGQVDVGRVLPREYEYFDGDGRRNYFTTEWRSEEHWDWGLPSPYED